MENSLKLCDISLDLYTDGGISWNGKQGGFTEEEPDDIVDHIAFRNFPKLEGLTDGWELPEPSATTGSIRTFRLIILPC